MVSRSQVAANVAASVMCALVGVVAVQQMWTPVTPTVEPKAARLTVGAKIESFDTLAQGKNGTVVVVFSTECKFCIASVPFYKKLARLPRMDGVDLRLVILALSDLGAVTEYARANDLGADAVASFPRARPIEIQGTPTVLVLDGAGRLKGSWVGQLTPTAEAAVLASVLTPPGSTASK